MRRWLIRVAVMALLMSGCGDDDASDDASDQTGAGDPAERLAEAETCEELADVALEITEERVDEFDNRIREPDTPVTDDDFSDAIEDFSEDREEFDAVVAEAFQPFEDEFFDTSDDVGCGDQEEVIDDYCDELLELSDELEEDLEEGEFVAGANFVTRQLTQVCDFGG